MTDLALINESFRRNARVNLFLLDELTDADLARSDGQGGMTVAQLFSHMGASRGGWLQEMSPAHAASPLAIAGPTSIWDWHTDDRAAIRAMFTAGDQAALQAVQAHLDHREPFADPRGVDTFASNPAHFLLYMIVHDANHRGQIVALLRQGGFPPERLDRLEEQWNIWRK